MFGPGSFPPTDPYWGYGMMPPGMPANNQSSFLADSRTMIESPPTSYLSLEWPMLCSAPSAAPPSQFPFPATNLHNHNAQPTSGPASPFAFPSSCQQQQQQQPSFYANAPSSFPPPSYFSSPPCCCDGSVVGAPSSSTAMGAAGNGGFGVGLPQQQQNPFLGSMALLGTDPLGVGVDGRYVPPLNDDGEGDDSDDGSASTYSISFCKEGDEGEDEFSGGEEQMSQSPGPSRSSRGGGNGATAGPNPPPSSCASDDSFGAGSPSKKRRKSMAVSSSSSLKPPLSPSPSAMSSLSAASSSPKEIIKASPASSPTPGLVADLNGVKPEPLMIENGTSTSQQQHSNQASTKTPTSLSLPIPTPTTSSLASTSALAARYWLTLRENDVFTLSVSTRGSRQSSLEFSVQVPDCMYTIPYVYRARLRFTLKNPPPPHSNMHHRMYMPWNYDSGLMYMISLVEASEFSNEGLEQGLCGDVSARVCPQITPDGQSFYQDVRFWIGKGYLSYHFRNQQFRLQVTVCSMSTRAVLATQVSAPFMVMAKRKVAIHRYDTEHARLSRNNTQRDKRRRERIATAAGPLDKAQIDRCLSYAMSIRTALSLLPPNERRYIGALLSDTLLFDD